MGYNGSDRFKGNKRYGLFPAISAGWNLSEEKFMKPIFNKVAIDFFKIRASYGIVGSDRMSGARYLFVDRYRGDGEYIFGESPYPIYGLVPHALGNEDATWEKEKKLDIGVDMRLFNQRLSLVFDYFKNERYDILSAKSTIPDIASIPLQAVNLGRVSNKGLEIELTWRDKLSTNFDYFVRGNVSIAKNKILVMDEAQLVYPNLSSIGRPVGQIFGYVADGFYNSQADIDALPDNNREIGLGDIKYKDISGPNGVPDGVIDKYDMGPIGHPSIPQVTYGISLGASYKNFDFSLLFQGAAKGSIQSQDILNIGGESGRPRKIHKYRWTPENKEKAKFPRLGRTTNFETSTFWLKPRDYLRLKNVEIGYNLPKSLTSKVYLQSARIFTNGVNLFTLSKLSMYDVDPESSSGNAYGSYP
ncbi:MAG: SusC/RagA family TonB-linked outer membrane protein, partial [Bacteroides sp.]